jgi:hypothetical protein
MVPRTLWRARPLSPHTAPWRRQGQIPSLAGSPFKLCLIVPAKLQLRRDVGKSTEPVEGFGLTAKGGTSL